MAGAVQRHEGKRVKQKIEGALKEDCKFWDKAERRHCSHHRRHLQTKLHTRHVAPAIAAAIDAVNATSAESSADAQEGDHRQSEPSRVIL